VGVYLSFTDYQAKYFALELIKRSSAKDVNKIASSLLDAQVDLNPHQLEAALFAFKSPISNGVILADEVGLGKTIEAGIIISQKWAERKRKILIVVPANLRKQWSQELMEKFFLDTIILETATFNVEKNKGITNPFNSNQIVICSYQFARKQEAYIKLVEWDLVVIDEAHRLRNVYKPSNKIANTLKNIFIDRKKILLTATPLQNSLLELYGLVSIIDEYAFGDLESFKTRYMQLRNNNVFTELKKRLQPYCIRTLRKQVSAYIKYTKRIPITQEFYPTEAEQKLYDMVSEYLQEDELFALPKSQRKLMTLILRRLLASSTFAISGTLHGLAKKLDEIIEKNNRLVNPEQTIVDDYEMYDELVDEWEDDDAEEESKIYTQEEIIKIKAESEKLKTFCELANSIVKNSKGEVLLTALKKGFEELEKSGGARKAIIFTESTRTQKYLFELLQKTEFKDKIVLFNGTNTDHLSRLIYQDWYNRNYNTGKITGSKNADIRIALIEYFRDTAEIMIATEAAAEGVNLQFCSLVVNYDLPWNPQRIEQRIGRCHRYGQKFDVVVVNFLNKANAADIRVYQLLSEKFKLFEGVFGASDEVLGIIENGVDFEKRIAEIYQSCRTPQEIQNSFDLLQKELEEQINETIKNTKIKLLENFDQEVAEKLRIRDTESKQCLSNYQNWLYKVTKHVLKDYADFYDEKFSFNLMKLPFGDENIRLGLYSFFNNDNDIFYRLGHPLAKKIITTCIEKNLSNAEITFYYNDNKLINISILNELVGKEGFISLNKLSVCSFECEDYLIFSGITNDNYILDEEQCKRIMTLPAKIVSYFEIESSIKSQINLLYNEQKNKILELKKRNDNELSKEESIKLERWAEDIISNAENEVKITKNKIRELTRSLSVLDDEKEILEINKQIKELENKKRKQRQKIFELEDITDKKRNEIIDKLKLRMQQSINTQEIFTIKWKII
jgi:superfamily II DNA/RNA helicase